jgi:hypothetical protein
MPDDPESSRAASADAAKSWWGYLNELIPNAHIVLGLLALAVYGLVRVGYEDFYGTLSLQPEEVGLTYISIITRAALVGLYLAVFLVMLVAVAWLLMPYLSRPAMLLVLMGAIQLVLGIVYLAFVVSRPVSAVTGGGYSGESTLTGESVLLICLGVLTLTYVLVTTLSPLAWRLLPWRPILTLPSAALARAAQAWSLLLIATSLITSLDAFATYGTAAATRLETGSSSASFFFSAVFYFRSDSVCPVWAGNDQPSNVDLSKPLLFLGESDGVDVLYRPLRFDSATSTIRPAGPVRIPTNKVIITPALEDQRDCKLP